MNLLNQGFLSSFHRYRVAATNEPTEPRVPIIIPSLQIDGMMIGTLGSVGSLVAATLYR
jgi:hypothetical protein